MDAAHFVSSRTALCLRHAGFHAFDCKSYYDNKDFLRLFPRRGEVTGGWYEAAPIAEAIDWLQVKYDVIIDVTWEGIERDGCTLYTPQKEPMRQQSIIVPVIWH